MNPRRSGKAGAAEALAVELDMAAEGHTSDDPRVQIAARLRATSVVRETWRERTKDRTLRAFQAAGTAVTEDAGTRDSIAPEANVARLEFSDGSEVLMADVETITPEKAAKVAELLRQLAAEHETR